MEWPGTDKQKEKQLFIVTQNQKLLKDIYIFANKKKSLKFFIVPQKQRTLIFFIFHGAIWINQETIQKIL